MMRRQIVAARAAQPKGPFSQAIATSGQHVYVAGQGPVDPETGELRLGSFREQAELTLKNITAILAAAGCSWEDVVKVNAYLADLSNFPVFNEVYQECVVEPYPARTTVQSGLNRIAIEIDCVAVIPQR